MQKETWGVFEWGVVEHFGVWKGRAECRSVVGSVVIPWCPVVPPECRSNFFTVLLRHVHTYQITSIM